jgi:hypothetical protein
MNNDNVSFVAEIAPAVVAPVNALLSFSAPANEPDPVAPTLPQPGDHTACKGCKGTGKRYSRGFVADNGRVYLSKFDTCSSCEGAGYFPDLNKDWIEQILKLILVKQGKNKGKLKTAAPPRDGLIGYRAYYVWRLARFHGGADVTMPMMADLFTRNDPMKDQLDQMSEVVAKATFGTDMGAVNAWGRAFSPV